MENGFSGRRRLARAQRAVTMLMAVSVTGCAINPIVDWKAKEPPVHAGRIDVMRGAQEYAKAYKEAVHTKARDYAGAQVQLNDGLLGLGLLALTAVAYNAHRDVGLGFGILAAGTYMYGTQNLGKPRLDVYQSGIGAINCALVAVEPLNFTAADLAVIDTLVGQMAATDRPELEAWLATARVSFQASELTAADQQKEVADQLAAAAATLEYARTTLDEAAVLRGRVETAAGALKATVDVIASQVDNLASKTIVDPASTQRSLTNLVSLVSAYTPGTDIGSTATNRLTPSTSQEKTRIFMNGRGERQTGRAAADGAPLSLAGVLARLAHARSKVHGQAQMLAGAVAKAKGYTATEFLKACGVSDALIALRVEEEVVTINVGDETPPPREVRVSGGAKNYTGRFLDTVPTGVELVQPRAGEGVFLIKVPKTVTKDTELKLRIEDSSSPPQAKTVAVKIVAPAKKDGDGGGAVPLRRRR